MESKSYRTTSDVIVIYEANDTEGKRGDWGAAVLARLVNPKKQKHDMGGRKGITGRKEEGREEKVHKFGDSIFP